MELWDVFDENRHKTGKKMYRGDKTDRGEYHLVVFAFIRNHKGEYLISKRAANKTFPGKWEITGGAALSGEDSLGAIIREVKEELGIQLEPKCGSVVKSVRVDRDSSYFADIWFFEYDFDAVKITCQEEEVSEVRIVTGKELRSLIEKGLFIENEHVIGCFEYLSFNEGTVKKHSKAAGRT